MKKLQLRSFPKFPFIGFYGEESGSGDQHDWTRNGPHLCSDTEITIGIANHLVNDGYEIDIQIDEEAGGQKAAFLRCFIYPSIDGIEISDVFDSSEKLDEGNMGFMYRFLGSVAQDSILSLRRGLLMILMVTLFPKVF